VEAMVAVAAAVRVVVEEAWGAAANTNPQEV
jgi:hypothetical protein